MWAASKSSCKAKPSRNLVDIYKSSSNSLSRTLRNFLLKFSRGIWQARRSLLVGFATRRKETENGVKAENNLLVLRFMIFLCASTTSSFLKKIRLAPVNDDRRLRCLPSGLWRSCAVFKIKSSETKMKHLHCQFHFTSFAVFRCLLLSHSVNLMWPQSKWIHWPQTSH